MNVKKCDRCGKIIENGTNCMVVRGDRLGENEYGRYKSCEFASDLCEECMNELKQFMAGKEEPEEPEAEAPEEAPSEAKGTSKFVDMILQMRSMMKFCDADNDCEKCPLYKLNEDEDLICGARYGSLVDFVREFIKEAANDPIVQHTVLNKLAYDKEDAAFSADDALEDEVSKLSKKLLKRKADDVYMMDHDEKENEDE